MDLETNIVKSEDVSEAAKDVFVGETKVGEGDTPEYQSTSSLNTEIDKDHVLAESETVIPDEIVINGDGSEVMSNQGLPHNTHCKRPDDTTSSEGRIDEEPKLSANLECEAKEKEFVDMDGDNTGDKTVLHSDEIGNIGSNGFDMVDKNTNCSSKTEKQSTEGSWSEGYQDCSELMQDENLPEEDKIIYQSDTSNHSEIGSPERKTEVLVKIIPDPNECGDNAITNKTVEESEAQLQGVEIISLRADDIKNELSEQERVEEGALESQRPRSRTYPFKALVSGLPIGARREDILRYFSQFGEVLKVWDEGRHRANILYADEESFKKAVFAPDPYFDDHKLLIRSLNETVTAISGIPRSIPGKDAEKAVKSVLEDAGVAPCRIMVPLIDPTESTETSVIQGYAFVAFADPQTLQKADDLQNNKQFVIADSPVKIHQTCNEFYEKFCIRVYPLPSEQQRAVVYHHLQNAFTSIGEVVAILIQYVGSSMTYAGYVMFDSEDSVKKAKEMEDVNILGEYVHVQDFHPFEQGHGFRHLWLKVLNLPQRITVTEIKNHFGHDKGILKVELDPDFGSCFIHINSESALQRCLRMHQTYLKGKCIAVMLAEDHPERGHYREVSRRGRRPNFRNGSNRKKSNMSNGFNGKTFTSATQPQGTQDRRGFDRGDRKFSKSRSNHPKEASKVVKGDGDGVKIADAPAV